METLDIKLNVLIKRALFEPELITQLIEKYGEIIRVKFGRNYIYFIADPNFVKHIFIDHATNYIKSAQTIGMLNEVIGNYGLPSILDTALWKKDREILGKLFQKDKLAEYVAIMVNTTAKEFDHWQPLVTSGQPLNIDRAYALLTMHNLVNTLFPGVNINTDEIPYLGRILLYLTLPFNYYTKAKLLGIFPMPIFRNNKKCLEKLVSLIVNQSLAEHIPPDNLVKSLANAYGYRQGTKIDKTLFNHLHSEAITFLLAGHETTAALLGYVSILLSLYPLVAKEVYQEVKAILGSNLPTYADFDNLLYTRAVIKETLRLHPPVRFIARSAASDDLFQTHQIKQNDLLLIPIFTTHRISTYWSNSEGFDPSRFLQPLTEQQQRLYLPFGIGERNCIGNQFAVMEATTIIAMLAQRFHLSLTPGSILRYEPAMIDRLNKDITMKVEMI